MQELGALRSTLISTLGLNAEDAVQEALVLYWQKAAEVRDPVRWCRRVARRLHVRSRRPERVGQPIAEMAYPPAQEPYVALREVLRVLPAPVLDALDGDLSSRRVESGAVRARVARARARARRRLGFV